MRFVFSKSTPQPRPYGARQLPFQGSPKRALFALPPLMKTLSSATRNSKICCLTYERGGAERSEAEGLFLHTQQQPPSPLSRGPALVKPLSDSHSSFLAGSLLIRELPLPDAVSFAYVDMQHSCCIIGSGQPPLHKQTANERSELCRSLRFFIRGPQNPALPFYLRHLDSHISFCDNAARSCSIPEYYPKTCLPWGRG